MYNKDGVCRANRYGQCENFEECWKTGIRACDIHNMTVEEFLKRWSGDICLMNTDGSVYSSFRQNIPSELMNKEIKNIKLDRTEICILV